MIKYCECGCGREVIKDKNRFINGHNHPRHTEEFKQRLRKRQTGENNISKRLEVQEKMRKAKLDNPTKYWLGKKRKMDAKYMQSQRKIIGMQGKQHTKEMKENMSILKSKQTSEYIVSGKLFNGNSKYRGQFWSNKNNKYIYYQSFYEQRFLEILEQDTNVVSFDRCKIILKYIKNNKLKRYIPDFEICQIRGIKKIIEVKPLKLILYNLEKIDVLKDYCKKNNIHFDIFTEKELKINKGNYNSALEIKGIMLIEIGQELPKSTPVEMEALLMVTSVTEAGSLF